MGIVGAALVAVWAKNLLTETGKVLLDREMDHPVVEEIREAVESGPDAGETRIADLHVWPVGKKSYACAVSLVTHDGALTPQRVREQLAQHEEIVHATVEIQRCNQTGGFAVDLDLREAGLTARLQCDRAGERRPGFNRSGFPGSRRANA